jgi:2-amino-4-hydroxy-6-hydroxymethyldihydropteridine diphosphokinase
VTLAYVGLGANLGDPMSTVRDAISSLGELPATTLRAASSLYRTAPIDASGPPYINAVAVLETELAPEALLEALQELERRAGRERPYRHAPRTLDLDLLLHGKAQMQTERVTVPHPRLQQRAFVLRPLLEVAPDLEAPGLGRLDRFLPAVAGQSVVRLP